MEDKLIIEALVKAVKNGTLAIDKVPEKYREQVQAKCGEGE
jgi:hypothetical protein